MLRDNLVELIEPMLSSAGTNPLALTHHQIQASGDRLPCLENPRPKGAQSSLTENAPSPFQAEPAHLPCTIPQCSGNWFRSTTLRRPHKRLESTPTSLLHSLISTVCS